MTIEISLLISGISLAFAIYFGIKHNKRNETETIKSDTSQLTTVIVKLENIGNGVAKIENEISNVKNDMKEDRERIIRVEAAIAQVERRMDRFETELK